MSRNSPALRFALATLILQWLHILTPTNAHAIVNQVDGQIVPQTTNLQSCLDKSSALFPGNPAPGEGPGVLDAVRDASTFPQTFIPALTMGRMLSLGTVARM